MAGCGEQPGGVEDPPVAVELVLGGGGIAQPDWGAAVVAGPSSQFTLMSWPPSVQGEQHGQANSVEATGVEQPGQASAGFVGFADAQEGADADAGVAGPGVAVVPVADPAEVLRKRGGGGGHRRAGG